MTQQSEALRLADDLDSEFTTGRISNHMGRKAAAELRRLEALNAQLLKALEALVDNEDARSWGVFGVDNRSAFTKARAAIAAAKEKNHG